MTDDGDMVARSVYLTAEQDAELRRIAVRIGTDVGALVRAALAGRLPEWTGEDGTAACRRDAALSRSPIRNRPGPA